MKALFQSKLFLLLSSGLLLGLGWFPNGFPLLIMIGFVPMLYYLRISLSEGAKPLKVFFSVFLSFAIFNLITSWWIYNAGGITGLLAPIIVNGFIMSLTISLVYSTQRSLESKYHPLIFFVFWLSMEYLHSMDWDLSWPWMFLGNSLAQYPFLYQFYEYTGVRGGTLWILFVNYGFYKWFLISNQSQQRIKHIPFLMNNVFRLVVPILVSLIIMSMDYESNRQVNVRLVQPNIDPYTDKFDEKKYGTHEYLLKKLSFDSSDFYKPEVVLLPETSFPKGEWEENINRSYLINSFDKLRKENNVGLLITGISTVKRMKYDGEIPLSARELRDGGYYESYNTALAISDSGRNIYHKSRLVAGVEQIPFMGSLPFLKKLALDLGGASGTLGTQQERTVFEHDSIFVAPIICYESVYGEYVTDFVKNGANLLSIITNDAWWGDTPGYVQHFNYARLRAVENRRYVIRSANTGISGIINPFGKIESATEYNVDARVDGKVSLHDELTFFTKYGDVIGRLSLLLMIYLFLQSKIKKYQEVELDS